MTAASNVQAEAPLLSVRNLQKVFSTRGGDVRAVSDVSFEVRRGSIVGIVGESGSGKTTVGRCILRLVEPSGGDETFWVTDAGGHADTVIEALSRQEVAARLVCEAGGLRLFALAGFYQRDDARLARAPGRLSGVIGAAPGPFDV